MGAETIFISWPQGGIRQDFLTKLSLLAVAGGVIPADDAEDLCIVCGASTRYHSWMSEESCTLTDVSSCPRTSPHQLTSAEVGAVKEMVTSQECRHVPTGTLALLAQRLGKASPPRRHGTDLYDYTTGDDRALGFIR